MSVDRRGNLGDLPGILQLEPVSPRSDNRGIRQS